MRKLLLISTVLFFALIGQVAAQTRQVTGKVTSAEDGSPLPGVNISIKGTKKGTTTGVDGTYKIVVADGNTLSFSFIGFKNQVTNAGSQSIINVAMTPEPNELQEVKVTAMGIQRQAKELGYATSSIKAKELVSGKAVNIAQSLNSKFSGVSITTTNSGVFENSRIIVRGIRSLTGNNTPLYVLDGSPVPSTITQYIAPDDIDDITVLKSASSAALYGPDAVNGVIYITTKKGTTNSKPLVSFNSSYTANKVAFFPKLQHEFGPGAGEILDQYGNYGYVGYENQNFGPRFDGSTQEIGVKLEDGSVQTGPYSNLHKDDKENFYNTGSTFQNALSILGKNYSVSLVDAQIKGMTPKDERRRTSFRFSGNQAINKFGVDYSVLYTHETSNVVNESAIQSIFPGSYSGGIMNMVMQVGDNVPLLSYSDWRNNKFATPSNYFNEFATNPYWVIDNARAKSKTDAFNGNLKLTYDIIPELKATVRANIFTSGTLGENITYPQEVSDWAIANRTSTHFFNSKGAYSNANVLTTALNIDYFLNGKKTINKDFEVFYVAGGNINQTDVTLASMTGNNLIVPGLFNVSVRSGEAVVGNSLTQQRRLSYYGTAGVGYKGWGFLELTGRNDRDSRLLMNNRSFFYPGANASVILSDALPAISNYGISFLKLRAAYSKSANVNLSPYSLQATYTPATGFPFGSLSGFTANNSIPSADLRPESVTSKEIGFDLGILNNKVNIEMSYFNQLCEDQILSVSKSSATGYTSGLANAATFKNYGVETDLKIKDIKVGRGVFSVKVNATYNNNEVISTLDGNPVVLGGTANFIQVSRNEATANNYAGVGGAAFQFQLSDYKRTDDGKVIVDAVTGLPTIDTDLKVKGRSLPLWEVGFTPRYRIGNLAISMTWGYKGGYNFYSALGSNLDFSGLSARSAEYGRQRFVFPNSVYSTDGGKTYINNTNIQVSNGIDGFWAGAINTSVATNYFSSADALRLREVNVSFNIPTKWLGKFKAFSSVELSVVGRNLLLFVPSSNQWGDPEFNFTSTGNTYGLASGFQTPASRQYGFSLSASF